MKKILITGGCGLIGSHLARHLYEKSVENDIYIIDNLTRGIKLNIIDFYDKKRCHFSIADLRNRALTIALLSDMDEVYHLAASIGGVEYIHSHPIEALVPNMQINGNVLEGVAKSPRVKKLLFTSTACIYPVIDQGFPDSAPLKEELEKPYDPESLYGWAKLVTEFGCAGLTEQTGKETAIGRLFNVYGPGEVLTENSHVIPLMLMKVLNGEPMEVYSDGKQTRAFAYVEDMAEALTLLMEKGCGKGPVNIGDSKRFNMWELAETVMSVASELEPDRDVQIIQKPDKPAGVIGRACDYTKMNKLTGWKPTTSLKEGITNTYRWAIYYLKVLEEVRKSRPVGVA